MEILTLHSTQPSSRAGPDSDDGAQSAHMLSSLPSLQAAARISCLKPWGWQLGSVCCHRSLCSGYWPSTLSLPSRSLRASESKWFGWVAPFASCSLRQGSDLCPSHAHPSLLPFSLRGCNCQPCSHRALSVQSATGPDSPRRRREELGREVLPEDEGKPPQQTLAFPAFLW